MMASINSLDICLYVRHTWHNWHIEIERIERLSNQTRRQIKRANQSDADGREFHRDDLSARHCQREPRGQRAKPFAYCAPFVWLCLATFAQCVCVCSILGGHLHMNAHNKKATHIYIECYNKHTVFSLISTLTHWQNIITSSRIAYATKCILTRDVWRVVWGAIVRLSSRTTGDPSSSFGFLSCKPTRLLWLVWLVWLVWLDKQPPKTAIECVFGVQ